jgi:hypothetical protein
MESISAASVRIDIATVRRLLEVRFEGPAGRKTAAPTPTAALTLQGGRRRAVWLGRGFVRVFFGCELEGCRAHRRQVLLLDRQCPADEL